MAEARFNRQVKSVVKVLLPNVTLVRSRPLKSVHSRFAPLKSLLPSCVVLPEKSAPLRVAELNDAPFRFALVNIVLTKDLPLRSVLLRSTPVRLQLSHPPVSAMYCLALTIFNCDTLSCRAVPLRHAMSSDTPNTVLPWGPPAASHSSTSVSGPTITDAIMSFSTPYTNPQIGSIGTSS